MVERFESNRERVSETSLDGERKAKTDGPRRLAAPVSHGDAVTLHADDDLPSDRERIP
jgi:hypothetical protein